MGQEIAISQFSDKDFERFHQCLQQETHQLQQALERAVTVTTDYTVGMELEAWLVEKNMHPAPINDYFLNQLGNPQVNAELAKFNIEFNTHPHQLTKNLLFDLHEQLQNAWSAATQQAQRLDTELMMIGILPTLNQADLTTMNMSSLNRYQALNEQILNARSRPVELDINGVEHLKLTHHDVMLESATTSLQLHTKVPIDIAHHFYNASIMASSIMVAVAGNSPFLFGKQLWHETRIPLFEQAIETGGYEGAAHGPIKRVSFGSDYARQSIFECFQENLEHFPVLLPVNLSQPTQLPFAHLRLHNGTIWRWNRPLVGFDDNGSVHIRIEHRTPAAGPSVIDTIANAAFYFGLSKAICNELVQGKPMMNFSQAKDNFYKAARYGLDAHILDSNGESQRVQTVILKQCLPQAFKALIDAGLPSSEVEHYLSVIERRVVSHQTGSDWQIAFINKYGRDFAQLSKNYLYHQQRNEEVSQWPI